MTCHQARLVCPVDIIKKVVNRRVDTHSNSVLGRKYRVETECMMSACVVGMAEKCWRA